ncbi:TIR-like protein FxsC [Streptomyces sp. NPDC001493]
MTEPPELFGLLGTLAARLGMTAEELADAVLLAAAGFTGDTAASEYPAQDTDPQNALPGTGQPDLSPKADPSRSRPATGGHSVSAYGPATGETHPGVRVTLGQAAALPQALSIGRALRPLRRRWLHGHRTELNVDATVEDYARTGLLVPHLVPMPERWLDVTVVLDRSSSMGVWNPAADGLNRILRSLGALRTLNTWHLTWNGTDPVLRDQRGALVPAGQAGRRGGQPGRRLMVVLSDCAAPGWRDRTVWKQIYLWSGTTSIALFNPLPSRLWHRTAMDLPLTVTTAPTPVAPSGSWRYEPAQPRRLRRETSIRAWRAVPVLGTDPEDLRRWARTLMRGDPEGCTAVLLPDTGRPPQRPRRTPAREAAIPTPDAGAKAAAFLRTARTPATRLAIHAAALDTFTLPILHALREQAVPEARLDDFAELITADLCTVQRNPEADDLYTFRPEALDHLRQKLTRQTAWRTHQALTRHIASRPWTPDGFAAVVQTAAGTPLPSALVPFAEAADSVLRQLGVTLGPATAPGRAAHISDSAPVLDPAGTPSPPEPASGAAALRERLREVSDAPPQDWLVKIRLLESLAADHVRLLGERHPDTASARASLATSYYEAGRVEEAAVIRERVLADFEAALGDQHPDTLSARADLATSYYEAGRVDEAIAMEVRVLAGRQRVLGDQHPDTITARADLAAFYHRAGRYEEAGIVREGIPADREQMSQDGPIGAPEPVGRVAGAALPAAGAALTPSEPGTDPDPGAGESADRSGAGVPGLRSGKTRRGVSLYFFLSYARTPENGAGTDQDMWVERLFQDLCGHVMAMTDLPVGTSPGFMDRQSQPGENWPDRLSEMLADCRVFVPLISPRYFTSEMCGKEWHAFEQRTIHHRAQSNQSVEAIVPALWVPTPLGQLPRSVSRLQFRHRDFGERYATDGLYGLIKLRLLAQEYERAVYELAKRIVTVAETGGLEPSRVVPDLRLLPSAFGSRTESEDGRVVKITVVAPALHDLPRGRVPDSYGASAEDWNPYHPASARPLAHVAEELVRSLGYQAVTASFDLDSGPEGRRRFPDGPEILLIDRWALQDEDRRRRLAAFDRESPPWTTVVGPWNRDDAQSRASEAELTGLLERTMPVTLRQRRLFAGVATREIPTLEAFGQVLPRMVEAAAREHRLRATPHPPAV